MTRIVTDAEKKELLELTTGDLTFTKLVSLFGASMKKSNGKVTKTSARFSTTDSFNLKKGEYFNSKDVVTTVGRFIYNKFIVEQHLVDILGYINEPINGKKMNQIDDIIAQSLLSDKLDVDTVIIYLNRTQWLGMKLHTVICGSYTMGILKPEKKAIEYRDKLIKANREKLDNGDLITAVKVEQETLKMAAELIKDDPGMDLFNSGARGSIGNNYKNISVMKGPVFNPGTGKFEIVTSNLMQGISKKEIPIHGNAIPSGAYPKAVGTAVAGYFSKQLIAALQAVIADVPGSDCGTKLTLKQVLSNSNKSEFSYRYIVDGGKLVLLSPENIGNYVGKQVLLRSPAVCNGKNICSKCLGEMYYMLGIRNVGLTSSRAASTILKLNMKKFHDATAKTIKVELYGMFM